MMVVNRSMPVVCTASPEEVHATSVRIARARDCAVSHGRLSCRATRRREARVYLRREVVERTSVCIAENKTKPQHLCCKIQVFKGISINIFTISQTLLLIVSFRRREAPLKNQSNCSLVPSRCRAVPCPVPVSASPRPSRQLRSLSRKAGERMGKVRLSLQQQRCCYQRRRMVCVAFPVQLLAVAVGAAGRDGLGGGAGCDGERDAPLRCLAKRFLL